MKKIWMLLCCVFIGVNVIAQVQRKSAVTNKTDSSSVNSEKEVNTNVSNNADRQKVLQELNLTREQKGKLKEIRQSNQLKRTVIMNDPALTEAQKKEKLKETRQAIAIDLKGILTDEQMEKMKAMRADKIAERNDGSSARE